MAKKKYSAREESPIDLLAKDLFKRIKEFQSTGLYCITDRVNSFDFFDVFREAINSYRQDTVVCERLFLKTKCAMVKRPAYTISEATQKVYNEFINFSEKELSGDITDDKAKKLEEFQAKLNSANDAIDVKEVDVLTYKSGYNGDGYIVMELSEIPDDALEKIAHMISRFVFEYFLTLKFVATDNYAITIFPVQYDEHVDIVAQFTVQ